MASIFKGLDQQLVDVAEGFGTRTLFIYKFEPGKVGPLTREERMRKPLTYEQAMALEKMCPSVETVGVEIFNRGPAVTAKYKGQEMVDANFNGATPDDFQNINADLQDGRLLYQRWTTCIGRMWPSSGPMWCKGSSLGEDPIGKEIQVDGHSFEVIGTLAKRKSFLGDNGNDRVVLIPYFTFKSLYPRRRRTFVTAMAFPGKLDQAKDEATAVLRRLRNDKPFAPDSFGIATAQTFISNFRDIMGTVVLVTMVISSIGLMVGGIGVMNIMLVSVTERTREIGVRKAIGARRSDITWQFLLEAMTLTGAGGVLGILAGVTLSFLIRTLCALPPFRRPPLGGRHGLRGFRQHRLVLWNVARHEGFPPRSHRRPAARISCDLLLKFEIWNMAGARKPLPVGSKNLGRRRTVE